MEAISIKIGVVYTPSLMFLVGLIAIIVYNTFISLVATKQNKAIIRLIASIYNK